MKFRNAILATSAVALTCSLAATPAFAEPFEPGAIQVGDFTDTPESGGQPIVTGSGAYWILGSADGSLDHAFVYLDGVKFFQVLHYGGALSVDGELMTPSGELDQTTEESTGDVVTVGQGTFGALQATTEFRLYAEGDLFRSTYVLTNNTAAPITFTPSVYLDLTDAYSASSTTSSGDLALTTDDYWFTQFNSEWKTAAYSNFWGAPGQTTVTDVGTLDLETYTDDDVVFGDITIAPDSSFQWILFSSMATYDLNDDLAVRDAAAIAAGAAAAAEFGGATPTLAGSERLTRGLDLDIASNWFAAPTVEAAQEEVAKRQLAETGSEGALLLAVAGPLAIIGAILFMSRRRFARD